MTVLNKGVMPLQIRHDVAFIGHAVKRVGAITPSDNTLPANGGTGIAETDWFEDPLRMVRIGGAGNLTITLHDDDADDATTKVTIPVNANDEITKYAIRRVWATGTTCTGIVGFR